MAVTPVSPGTVVGVDRLALVPSPSCPSVLDPQQDTVPASCLSAHEWRSPAAMGGVGAGIGQAECHKNTAICARVTGFEGENLPSDVPEVICCSTSHVTAVS